VIKRGIRLEEGIKIFAAAIYVLRLPEIAIQCTNDASTDGVAKAKWVPDGDHRVARSQFRAIAPFYGRKPMARHRS
jgi:hypothetical protein